MSTCVFLEPLDVLFLRGNKLFGDPGSFGAALVPPWPSVVAGALRSRMLVDAGVDLAAFARGAITHPTLGTPATPGSFRLCAFHLARRHRDGRVELLVAPPADLVFNLNENAAVQVRALTPTAFTATAGTAITWSAPLARLPVLAESQRHKPASGWWLTEAGWRQYLAGQLPAASELVHSSSLWQLDTRVGVGLDAARGSASAGRLFSMQAVCLGQQATAGFDVGFLAEVDGAEPPQTGLLRLGGDGRAAAIHPADVELPVADYTAIAKARRCRMVLTTPGIFADGWLPTGAQPDLGQDAGSIAFDLRGVRGRIVCAALARADVVSGWDLAQWQPKPAERVAPAGSVYWLEDLDASPDDLGKLAETGLWPEPCNDSARRAEGFNRFNFAAS